MNHKKNLLLLFCLAFSLSILGFIIDIGERVPNVLVNILDISMMTLLIFTVLIIPYGMLILLQRVTNKEII
ncbi:hypothetical protein [Aquimarina rhabdastrellae]